MAIRKNTQKDSVENKVEAFFNWTALNKHGEEAIRSGKGFAIFDNQYTTRQERQLVELAQKNGGEITMNCVVTVRVNKQKDAPEINPEDFV